MWTDVSELREFYGGPLGRVARAFIAQEIAKLWDDLQSEKVVGLGYATPFLSAFRGRSERALAFMPARQGVINWPARGPSASALVGEDLLPLTDGAAERVIIAHCLEHADSPQAVLREAWRVLAPGGRLIVVVSNRRGLWARFDLTPFGHGRPFSRSQLTRLFRETGFSPGEWHDALFLPPVRRASLLRAASVFEKAGRYMPVLTGGVLIVEAQKQFGTSKPIRAMERVRRKLPELARPAGATASANRDV